MINKVTPGAPVGRRYPPTMQATGAYPLTPSETAIVNYFNKELEKIEVKLNEIKRVLEQMRDDARERDKK